MRTLKLIREGDAIVTLQLERFNVAPDGKRFVCDFIFPGLIDYSDAGSGIELLRQNAIDAALQTMVGTPLTIGHVPGTLPSRGAHAHGFCDKVYRNNENGGYTCEGTVETDSARQDLRNGKRPSVGFIVEQVGPGGRFNNVAYVQELTRIKFHHLAIVENPRISDAKIRLNAVGSPKAESKMKILKFLSKITRKKADGTGDETVDQPGELPADAQIEIAPGVTVRANELVESHNALAAEQAEADKKKKDAEALERQNSINESTMVDVGGGVMVSVKTLLESHNKRKGVTETAEQKTARENALKSAEGDAAFKILADASTTRDNAVTPVSSDSGSIADQLARGKKMFGSN